MNDKTSIQKRVFDDYQRELIPMYLNKLTTYQTHSSQLFENISPN